MGAVDLRPVAYPPEAILTTEQMAEWLQVSPRLVEAMHLPKLLLPGSRMVRYSAGQVLQFLESGNARVA